MLFYLLRIVAEFFEGRPDRTGQAESLPIWSRCSVCVSIEATVFFALAGDELWPFLLCMDHGYALKSHPRLVGDHLVQGQLYFCSVGHSNITDRTAQGFEVRSIALLEDQSVRAKVRGIPHLRYGAALRVEIPLGAGTCARS